MKRQHRMPFGASIDSRGQVHFKLWAPDATEVGLNLGMDGEVSRRAMRGTGGGWFGISLADVAPGSRYTFSIDGRLDVPDPASRFNPEDVHGASEVIDPLAFEWPDEEWRGRPWEEAVIYELHVGTFTPEGTFNAAIERLDYLVRLGVTAVELMPIADFPGQRNWGYDGVLPYAPDSSYGRPEDLKSLVAAAHARGLMIFLDVVYNHFGPEGNYLHAYAQDFFNPAHTTPWGAAINFDAEYSRVVRDFFIHNALYWLDEYHFDGLRLDAIHAIADDTVPDVVTELASAMRTGPGQGRHVHLILENDRNEASRLLRDAHDVPRHASAQWNDDFHHAMHVLATGEGQTYYRDFTRQPLWQLGRSLAEGFAFQGEPSVHRDGRAHGEASGDVSPTAFVNFLQNHDQVGNRAFGERLSALAPAEIVRLGVVCTLLAPAIPMLFMGEEFAASTPFLFFCDFGPDLAPKVVEGRRAEFAAWDRFRTPESQAAIPDPGAVATFQMSKLKWAEIAHPDNADWHSFYAGLLELRRRFIVPHLSGTRHAGRFTVDGGHLCVDWSLGDGTRLHLRANFSAQPWTEVPAPAGVVVWAEGPAGAKRGRNHLAPWSASWIVGSRS